MLTWSEIINEEQEKPYFQEMLTFIDKERMAGKKIYPPTNEVFNAFKFSEFNQIKVVIIGQDPYHGINQANGLAFSVNKKVKIPPSLQNIYKALQVDYPKFTPPLHGDLTSWAKQGVLLLNTVLTVEEGKAHSHAKIGWETFTDKVIEKLNFHSEHLVFLLWGSHAQKKGQFIDRTKHAVLTSVHPSPLSAYRGFFDCGHFAKTNAYLKQHQLSQINWQLEE